MRLLGTRSSELKSQKLGNERRALSNKGLLIKIFALANSAAILFD